MSEADGVAQTTAPVTVPVDAGKVATIKQSINIADTAQITAFGERAQQEVAGFADRILAQTRNRELGDTGALLTDIIDKAKGLDAAELQKSGFLTRWFGGLRKQISRFQSKFEVVATQIDRVTLEREKRIDLLPRDPT